MHTRIPAFRTSTGDGRSVHPERPCTAGVRAVQEAMGQSFVEACLAPCAVPPCWSTKATRALRALWADLLDRLEPRGLKDTFDRDSWHLPIAEIQALLDAWADPNAISPLRDLRSFFALQIFIAPNDDFGLQRIVECFVRAGRLFTEWEIESGVGLKEAYAMGSRQFRATSALTTQERRVLEHHNVRAREAMAAAALAAAVNAAMAQEPQAAPAPRRKRL